MVLRIVLNCVWFDICCSILHYGHPSSNWRRRQQCMNPGKACVRARHDDMEKLFFMRARIKWLRHANKKAPKIHLPIPITTNSTRGRQYSSPVRLGSIENSLHSSLRFVYTIWWLRGFPNLILHTSLLCYVHTLNGTVVNMNTLPVPYNVHTVLCTHTLPK